MHINNCKITVVLFHICYKQISKKQNKKQFFRQSYSLY